MKKLFNYIKQNAAQCSVLFCIILYSNNINAQHNLINNYSFEDYTQCPKKLNAPPPSNWYLATNYLPLCYSNSCSIDVYTSVPYNYVGNPSYQYAHSGNAYIFLDYYNGSVRQYMQSKLKDSLRNKKSYYIEYFVNIPNTLRFACNNVALLLTNNAVYVDTNTAYLGVLPSNPQIYNYGNPVLGDTVNWTKVSAVYKAQGGEQFITLGNFKTNAQTTLKQIQPTAYYGAGYYIDDVSVIPLDSFNLKADAGSDTTITIGDSVFIGSYTNGIDTIKWLQNGIIPIDSTRPGFWVKPLVNTCYVLTQTVNGYISSDTVCVNVQPLPLKFVNYTCVPSLRGNERSVENTWQTANEINVSYFNIQRSTNGKDFITIGKVKANNKVFNEYSFIDDKLPTTTEKLTTYYRIQSIDNDGRKMYSEVKLITFNSKLLTVTVFPNPAKDVVNIVGKDIKEVRIINYLGQQIATGTNVRNDDIIINIKNFTKGLYIVQVSLLNKIENIKLVIE